MTIRALRGKLLFSVALAILVAAGLGFYADLPQVVATLAAFNGRLIPLVLGLVLINYGLRFLKWQFFLRIVGVPGLSIGQSALIFFTGLCMVITPGRVGEWLKSFLLREITGTPVSVSAPIIVAERVSDVLSTAILASVGLLVYGYGWQALIAILALTVVAIGLSQHRPLARWAIGICSRVPILSRRARQMELFYESTNQLLEWRNQGVAVGIGIVSWSMEGIAFYLVLLGLGLAGTWTLLAQAVSVLAASTVLGAASMLPGGLGVAEGSIAGLLLILGTAESPAMAAAATMVIRLSTLWFGVSLGVIAMVMLTARLPQVDEIDVNQISSLAFADLSTQKQKNSGLDR